MTTLAVDRALNELRSDPNVTLHDMFTAFNKALADTGVAIRCFHQLSLQA